MFAICKEFLMRRDVIPSKFIRLNPWTKSSGDINISIPNRFQLTDPAFCTHGTGHRFGKTDMRLKGI